MHEFNHYMRNGRHISFNTPTTRKSILAAAYNFEELVKPRFFGPLSYRLQLGYLLRTPQGVWVNPVDSIGRPITGGRITFSPDEQFLQRLLTHDRKVGDIYLFDNDGAFAPFSSFKTGGTQEAREFAEGGLARALEHVNGAVAPNLEAMARTYTKGVFVQGFDPKEPVFTQSVMRVVSLGPGINLDRGGLCVVVDNRFPREGYVFGVLQ